MKRIAIFELIRTAVYKLAMQVSKQLLQQADFVVLHDQGDHKYVFLKKNEPAGLKPDSKRTKGKPYIKGDTKIYDVKIDMKEHPVIKSPDGDYADIWVGTKQEADDQLEAIRDGLGGGTHFIRMVPTEEILKKYKS